MPISPPAPQPTSAPRLKASPCQPWSSRLKVIAWCRKHQRALAEALPAGELVMIDGAGHYPQLERTYAVEKAITGFADRLATQ